MTINTELDRVLLACDGVQTQFTFPFKIFSKNDLKVFLIDGSESTELVNVVDYELLGFDWTNGGDIQVKTVYDDSKQIFMLRDPAVLQETSFRNLGNFYPEVHENAFDRIYMILQTNRWDLDHALLADENYIWDFKWRQSKNVPLPETGDAVASAAYVLSQIKDHLVNILKVKGREPIESIKARTGELGDVWISSDEGLLTNPTGEISAIEPDDAVTWVVATDTYPAGWVYIGKLSVGSDGSTVYTEFQFSADGATDWHFPEQVGDKYMRSRLVVDGVPELWGETTQIAGADGGDGTTLYTWIKYADSDTGENISDIPNNKEYIGFAYNKTTQEESSNPEDYEWSKFKGEDGEPGQTIYTEFQFSIDGSTNWHFPEEAGDKYLRSRNVSNGEEGEWGLATKIAGTDGADGAEFYTWIKYADDVSGTGLSDDPTDKDYIGFAYNKSTATESTNPADYTWSKITGDPGADGETIYTEFQFSADGANWHFPDQAGDQYMRSRVTTNGVAGDWGTAVQIKGSDGSDGTEFYTWIKYADDASGSGLSDDPDGKEYIGLAYNKTSAVESTNPADYTWSLFKGTDGVDGKSMRAYRTQEKENTDVDDGGTFVMTSDPTSITVTSESYIQLTTTLYIACLRDADFGQLKSASISGRVEGVDTVVLAGTLHTLAKLAPIDTNFDITIPVILTSTSSIPAGDYDVTWTLNLSGYIGNLANIARMHEGVVTVLPV